MTVRVEDDRIVLEGRCPAEEADELLAALDGRPHAVVDCSQARRIHMAVLQVLYALRPKMAIVPDGASNSANLLGKLISKGDIETEIF